MAENIRKKIQEESAKVKAEEAKLGKELRDAGDNLVGKLSKAAGRSNAKVDDNAVPDD